MPTALQAALHLLRARHVGQPKPSGRVALADCIPLGIILTNPLGEFGFMVTLPGTRYAVTYCKPTNSRQLQGKHFPEHVDRRSPISQAAFVGKAWKLATDKARELGWIV